MTTPITPASIASSLITIRAVAPEVTDSAQSATTIKAQIGQLVSGTIFGMDQNGEPLLKSAQGDLALKLPYHLPSGTEVTLRMEAAPGGGLRARILSIDGQSPKAYEAQLSTAPAENALPQDTVSLTRNAALAPSPAQQIQQAALLPGETSPVGQVRAAELRSALGLPLPAAASTPATAPSLPAAPLSATLLSRSAELPALIQQLPPGFPMPTRLQTGAQLQWQIVGIDSPAMPVAQSAGAQSAAPQPTPPSVPTPSAPDAAPAPAPAFPPSAPVLTQTTAASPVPLAQATLQNALAAIGGEALMHAAPAAVPSPQDPTRMIAQIIGLEPGGAALLHTPLGMVRLPQPAGFALAEGMQLQLQWLGADNPLPPLGTTTGYATPPSSGGWLPLADRWAGLEDAVALLGGAGPANLPPLARLPHPGNQMGADLLFFLAALQQGDAEHWIGRTAASALAGRGRQDLLQRLGEDFAALAQPLLHSTSSQWQALMFPVWAEGELHQARLFVGRHPQEESETVDGRPPDTRFVLELTLSSLGDMQLCGLVRKPAPQATQFDLILRCKRELSAAQKADIQAIFESGAALTGYRGQLSFQQSPSFPEHPLESFTAAHGGFMV